LKTAHCVEGQNNKRNQFIHFLYYRIAPLLLSSPPTSQAWSVNRKMHARGRPVSSICSWRLPPLCGSPQCQGCGCLPQDMGALARGCGCPDCDVGLGCPVAEEAEAVDCDEAWGGAGKGLCDAGLGCPAAEETEAATRGGAMLRPVARGGAVIHALRWQLATPWLTTTQGPGPPDTASLVGRPMWHSNVYAVARRFFRRPSFNR